MPVVTKDELWPAPWMGARICWSLVQDGPTFRVCRLQGGKAVETWQVAEQDWAEGAALRDRMIREQEKGGIVVAGLPPHQFFLRPLSSPLTGGRKTREVWPSLLDAAIPYPVDQCVVGFLPVSIEGAGSACLAVGIRQVEVEEVLADWKVKGVDPDLLVPEPMALFSDAGCQVWLGKERTVWSFWQEGRFLSAGGARTRDQREKRLSRQQAALKLQESLSFSGPDADAQPELLERRLAVAGYQADPWMINLRTGASISPRLQDRRTGLHKRNRGWAILCLALLMMFPVGISMRMQRKVRMQEHSVQEVYRRIRPQTAMPSASQIPLLWNRFKQDGLQLQEGGEEDWKTPRVTRALNNLLSAAYDAEVNVSGLDLSTNRMTIELRGEQAKVEKLRDALQALGWVCTPPTGDADVWTLSGERDR